MTTENILKLFEKNIINEGMTGTLQIPKGTTSAKIITHLDMDGVFTALAMLTALEKQGIPKSRVTIDFTQYGNMEKTLHTRMEPKNKQQMVLVTDYAKLSKRNIADIINKLTNFKGKFNTKFVVNMYENEDISKMSFDTFKSKLDEYGFHYSPSKFSDQNLKDLYISLKAIYPKKLDYNTLNNDVDIDKPDFVTDHHDNSGNNLYGGKQGEIAIESPSNFSYAASKYIPGTFSKADLNAINMIDSAGYNKIQLENTLNLNKNFSGPDKTKNMAIILNCLLDKVLKTNPTAISWAIKNCQPSLVSFYNSFMQALKFSDVQLEVFELLKNGKGKEAEEKVKQLPKEMQKNWWDIDTYSKKQKYLNVNQWKNKNAKDLGNEITGYKKRSDSEDSLNKGDILNYNNFSIQTITNPKSQSSRFMNSLISFKGNRNPYCIRRWSNFFQASKNPLYKGNVDFGKVAEKVYADIENYLSSDEFIKKTKIELTPFKIKLIMKDIREKSGGHAGIFNFQGIDSLKPTSKELNVDVGEHTKNYYDMMDYKKRLISLNTSRKSRGENAVNPIPSYMNKIKEVNDTIMESYKKAREIALDKAVSLTVKYTNALYPVDKSKTEELKNSNANYETK